MEVDIFNSLPESGQFPEVFPSNFDFSSLPPLPALPDDQIPQLDLAPKIQSFPCGPQMPRMSPLLSNRPRPNQGPLSFTEYSFGLRRDKRNLVEVTSLVKNQLPSSSPKRTKVDHSRFFHSITGKQLVDPVTTNCDHYFNAGQVEVRKPCPKCKEIVKEIIVDQLDKELVGLLSLMKHEL